MSAGDQFVEKVRRVLPLWDRLQLEGSQSSVVTVRHLALVLLLQEEVETVLGEMLPSDVILRHHLGGALDAPVTVGLDPNRANPGEASWEVDSAVIEILESVLRDENTSGLKAYLRLLERALLDESVRTRLEASGIAVPDLQRRIEEALGRI